MNASSRLRRTAVIPLVTLLAVPALADVVLPGHDLLRTQPGTYFDFATIPIPPDFFGPGSDPFDGTVHFAGAPQPNAACPLDPPVDTIVRRPAPGAPPETIPIEIVALNLVSVNPITVTYRGGSSELWDVRVELGPQILPPGQMALRHETPSGGTFSATLPVQPRFTFTSVGDPFNMRILDGLVIPFSAYDVPWVHVVPPAGSCTSNFCMSPSVPVAFTSPFGVHVVSATCSSGPTAAPETARPTWGRVKTAYR